MCKEAYCNVPSLKYQNTTLFAKPRYPYLDRYICRSKYNLCMLIAWPSRPIYGHCN